MAGRRKRSSPSPFSIGNCKVEIEGDGFVCESSGKGLLISSSSGGRIQITADDDSRKSSAWKSHNSNHPSNNKSQDDGSGCFSLEGHSFLLVNPKDVDSRTKSLLQEVLKIYMEELPTMNFAANTGKESQFLEKCISSGKYRTLLLKSDSAQGLENVIAAVSYQIIPADTQYAEIPLAAVSSRYQNKGIGRLMYKELKERLGSVGILTIFCWADKESEGFWLKQGFISIGEVNSKGKARRLPLKADIRRALCFPGGSTLMVAHLKKETVASMNSMDCISLKVHALLPSYVPSKTSGHVETSTNDSTQSLSVHMTNSVCEQIENTHSQKLNNGGCSTVIEKAKGVSLNATRFPCCANSVPCTNVGDNSTGVSVEVTENGCSTDVRCSFGHGVKRPVWEASLSSLKSKRVRGGHFIDRCKDMDKDLASIARGIDAAFTDWVTTGCKSSVDITLNNPTDLSDRKANAEGEASAHLNNNLVLQKCPRIMFMNMADESKKSCLTKIVEALGGSVTCNGSSSTHIITGKARRTLNFCVALSSGAWIVSPHWLRASFREGKFLGESQFILEDEDYRLKYKTELRVAVARANTNPHSLLSGYNVCLAKHIQPSVDVLSIIIKSAGGNIIRKLEGVLEPSKTIFLACEEDMEDAMVAARKRVWTFSSDWFMNCVMKQELDLEAPQFAESL